MYTNRRQWLRTSLLAGPTLLLGNQLFARDAFPNVTNAPNWEPYLRLNWNENPYGPSEKAKEALRRMIEVANHYPDPEVAALKKMLADKHNLGTGNFLITAGSTELLALLGQHVALKKGEILTPWPSFPTMMMFAEPAGATIRKIPMPDNGVIDLDKVSAAITKDTSLVFICNPNNPSSTEVDTEALKAFCKKVPNDVLICIDEAYIEYSSKGEAGSMVSLVNALPNLVICRTFSKAHGLAGLRIGYGISQRHNIDALRKRHLGFELAAGIAPIEAAKASLQDPGFLKRVINKNQEGREIVYAAFNKWGVDYYPSATNFIYARSGHFDNGIVQKIKRDNILITQWPDIMQGFLRITVSRPQEMEMFVKAAKGYLV